MISSDYKCFGEGSINGHEYDPGTRSCTCKPGWFDTKCDKGKLVQKKLLFMIKYKDCLWKLFKCNSKLMTASPNHAFLQIDEKRCTSLTILQS